MLGVWNAVVFGVYAADKIKAIRGARRICEARLLTLAFLGGGVGGATGVLARWHKIRKPKFLLVYLFAALHVAAAVLVCVLVF